MPCSGSTRRRGRWVVARGRVRATGEERVRPRAEEEALGTREAPGRLPHAHLAAALRQPQRGSPGRTFPGARTSVRSNSFSTIRRATSLSLRLRLRAKLRSPRTRGRGQPPYCARTPLACSMTTRLFSAVCSCSASTSPGGSPAPAGCRSWRRRPAPGRAQVGSGSGPGVVAEQVERADRLAPQPQRQRVDRAEVAALRRPPRRMAASGRRASARSATLTGAAVWKQSRHGPSSLCSCNNSMHVARPRLEAATARSSRRASPSRCRPRRRQQLDAEVDQPVQQVDDVVVVDQGVGQGDEGPADGFLALARMVGSSQTPLERSHRYSMFSVNASRRATTSRATSMSSRSCTNACARIRASASAALMSSCTDTIPVAWWTSARWATA